MKIKEISKQDTPIFKALGILLIVFHNYFRWLEPNTWENEFCFSINHIKNLIKGIINTPLESINLLFDYFGHYGVQIFIFMSGVGLTISMCNKKTSYGTFILKRLKVIYAMLIVAVVIFFLYSVVVDSHILDANEWRKLSWKFLLIHTLIPGQALSINGPWWFFGLVAQLYILFPLLFNIIKKYNVKGFAIICLFSFLCTYLEVFVIHTPKGILWFTNSIAHLPEFAFGIVIAMNFQKEIKPVYFITALIVFILSNFSKAFFPLSFLSITIILYFIISKLIPIINKSKWFTKILLRVGTLSMAIFIVHGFLRWPFLVLFSANWFDKIWGALLFFITVYAIAIVANIFYKWIYNLFDEILKKKFMTNSIISLASITDLFPNSFSEAQIAKAKTLFYKKMALKMHAFCGGKMQTLPKAPIYGFNWFNVWYTPGVSAVSTAIRNNNDSSFELSNRRNLVAVVSDSTRVLGDGDCTPPGGLGVMEGKAMLMKYLGGVDAIALCMDSRDETGEPNADKIIEFVKRVQSSFGAINLEDISQPNCFKVLDTLREECNIPVWHDDAQGTACVTLAGVINALKLTGKKMPEIKVVLYGAGASNTSIARLMIADGVNPNKIIMFDSRSTLHKNNERYKNNPLYYRQWELCQTTNPESVTTPEEAFKDADLLVALSKPGPNTIKAEWINLMAEKPIVFVCANPVPEIYPYQAKEAGAYIVATGRGDFPNQVNNSVCFPSILKGTLLVSARKITDGMAICAAHSIAEFAENRGIHVENIMPNMLEWELFPKVAADVAIQAIKEGVALKNLTWKQVYEAAKCDIREAQELTKLLQEKGYIKPVDESMIKEVLQEVVKEVID